MKKVKVEHGETCNENIDQDVSLSWHAALLLFLAILY